MLYIRTTFGANSIDPDQTALKEQSDQDLHYFLIKVYELSMSVVYQVELWN